MLFGDNSSIPKNLICDFIQVFFHLCSQENLKIPNGSGYKNRKVKLIKLFLSFVQEQEWQYKIFTPENSGKNGAIDFYFRTLDNILASDSVQFTLDYVKAILNLIKTLNKEPYNSDNFGDKDGSYYRDHISDIKNKLSCIQKKLESVKPTQKELFKNIQDMFKLKKSSQTSKFTNNLLSGMPKNSKSKNKLSLFDKNLKKNLKTLKSSNSMGDILAKQKSLPTSKSASSLLLDMPKQKSSLLDKNLKALMLKSSNSTKNLLVKQTRFNNNKLFLNLNTFKLKTSQSNSHINSINIKFTSGNNNGQPRLENAYKANFKKSYYRDSDTK